MYYPVKVLALKGDDKATYLQVATEAGAKSEILKYNTGNGIVGEIRIDDGRRITAEQRKKLYATFRDIADWTGDVPEYIKELLKFEYCGESGEEYFSLSDCSVSTAREFINYVIEFVIQNGIPLQELAIDRTDDIGKYLYYCLKFRKCAICGRDGEVHHVDAIGMGNDRRKIDDSSHEKICLCREHHTEAHTIGRVDFFDKYKVYGIIYSE